MILAANTATSLAAHLNPVRYTEPMSPALVSERDHVPEGITLMSGVFMRWYRWSQFGRVDERDRERETERETGILYVVEVHLKEAEERS